MLKQQVLGEKLMRGVSGGLRLCLMTGGCECEGGEGFTSSSEIWLDYIESSGDPEEPVE